MALDQSGARQEAAQSYREVLTWDAINSIALNNLAYLLADAGGDLDEALKHARTANELFPGWATFLDTLGWVYYKRGETDAAVGQLCKAVRKNPRNVAYRQHLLRALEQKDEHSAMVEELKAALRNGGAGQTILALLDQMGK
jgi:tetratricopeptide (TPR) repeat protein